MTISSNKLTLTNVNVVDASGLTMLLKSNTTDIIVDGTNTLSTVGDNAVLCKNISVNKAPASSVKCSLQVTTGNVNIAGTRLSDTDLKYLIADDSRIIYITEQEYDNMLNSHYLYFNAMGGVVDDPYKIVMWNSSYGELPKPTKSYYDFIGWYTEPEGGEMVSSDTVLTTVDDVTIYAHWQIHPVQGWIKIQDLPSDAAILSRKYTYTLRSYTTSGSSSMSGWTKYDTKRTSWGGTQGPVYSNPANGSRNVWSEQYETGRTHHYVLYHRYSGGSFSTDAMAGSWARHQGPDVTYLENGYYSSYTGQRYKAAACSVCGNGNNWHIDYEYDDIHYGTRWYYQEPVYTYYYYKDESKESTSNPTGQSNVSNVQEWVQYRVK